MSAPLVSSRHRPLLPHPGPLPDNQPDLKIRGRIWFRRLMVWLVVPGRYCDRDRSTRRRFASYSIPTPVSEWLEGDVGLADRSVRFRQPVVDLPIHANLCVPVKVLTFMGRLKKGSPGMVRRG
jgi:hypothetical protein